MQSYYDLAYDGLFQVSRGWGHVEAPRERADGILEILGAIREKSTQYNGTMEKPQDGGYHT